MTPFARRMTTPALFVAALAVGLPAQASEADFLNRFEGKFAGSGKVSRNESENATNVKCTMAGTTSETSVSMKGTCRAAIIFSRKISADLKVDPAGNYTGTYVGSSIGPAALSGKRQGDAVVLTITWPEPVRGDTTATMQISNAGNGEMSIVITDEVSAGGPKETVSSIALAQS